MDKVCHVGGALARLANIAHVSACKNIIPRPYLIATRLLAHTQYTSLLTRLVNM